MFREREYHLTESNSQAELECRKALARAGFSHAALPAGFHWSQLINPLGDKRSAMSAYEDLLEKEPDNKAALEGLAYLYQTLGQHEIAAQLRRQLFHVEARDLGVNDGDLEDVVNYFLAKIGECPVPQGIPSAFVRLHFDRYAKEFESHLTRHLQYRVPQLIKSLVSTVSKELDGWRILDLGCGTGLLAQALSELGGAFEGVDLSPNMLRQAERKGVYHSLVQADMLEFLHQTEKSYDLVMAADVLNYCGALETLFQAVKNRLAENALFVFSIEDSPREDVDYVLRNTGRFQHSPAYIDHLAESNHFTRRQRITDVLRLEEEQPVTGHVFLLAA